MRRASLLHVGCRHLMGQLAVYNVHKQATTTGLGVWPEDKKEAEYSKVVFKSQ